MDKLKALWKYQAAETQLEQLEHALKTTQTRQQLVQQQKLFQGNQKQLKTLEQVIAKSRSTISEIAGQSESLHNQLSEKSQEIEETKGLPLDDLFLEDVEELVKEMEGVKAAIEMNRRKALSVIRDLEKSEIEIKETLVKMSKAKKTFDQLKEKHTEELKANRGDLERLKENADKASKGIPTDLIEEYQKIKQHSTPVIVPYENKRCQGCNMEIPSAHLQALRAGERVVFCENCGRILYNDQTSTTQEDE